MKRPLLTTSLAVTGVLLGLLHYKLKPGLDEKQLGAYTETMNSRIEWQGHMAPDFALKTSQADRLELSDQIGRKVIVLNFFATWCEPCRDEMPELNRYFNQHKAEPFVIIGIDDGEKQGVVAQFLREAKIDFPVGIDDGTIKTKYGVPALPTNVVIGVDGRVQFYESGSLANADVAFDRLLELNREQLNRGKGISVADYRTQEQSQPALPHRAPSNGSNSPQYTLDTRAKRIVAKMDCPCGCDDKVQNCSCSTASQIKKALASEDFKNKADGEIVRELNKRFCARTM